MEAFEIKRRTLYHWRKKLNDANCDLESLNERSRAPRKRRKRLWPKEIIEEIRRLRSERPNLGKEKLYPFVKQFCEKKKLNCPKSRTLGRIITDAPDKMRSRPMKLGPKGPENCEENQLQGQKTQGL